MGQKLTFLQDEAAYAYLAKQDTAMGELIEKTGRIEREGMDDLFAALCNTMIGQQISTKAQENIWRRVCEEAGEVTPNSINALDVEDLRSCGMSRRKASYLHILADAVKTNLLDLNALKKAEDKAVCRTLCGLPGIGHWTAEMVLLFCMQRPDVLSWGDYGIRRGLCMLHGHEALTKEQFAHYRALYSPYGSTASIYLWHLAGMDAPEVTVQDAATEEK